jgi:hypothetical protein
LFLKGHILNSASTSDDFPLVGEWRSRLLRSNSNKLCIFLHVSTYKIIDANQATAEPGQDIVVSVDLLFNNGSIWNPVTETTVFSLHFTVPARFVLWSELPMDQQLMTSSVAQVIVYASAKAILSNITVQRSECIRETER